MEAGLIAALVLVAANGFFVGAEFSIARLRPTQVAELLRERRPGARSAQHAVEHIDAYLSACQLGITLASLGLGAVGEPAFHDLLEPLLGDAASIGGFGVATLVAFSIITVAHVVLGELAPKSAAISKTVPVALLLCPPMRLFYLVTKPLVDTFNLMGNLVLRPFGVAPASEAGHAPHSEAELRELLRESHAGGMIDADESRLSEAALVFGDLRARDVMQPRPEIDFVSTDDGHEDVIETAIRTGRTRLPLVTGDGGLDSTIGVVNAKDLLSVALGKQTPELSAMARPLPKIAEGVHVDQLLREMRRQRHHQALVVDEHGTVTGLVTLEDVIEELVGEIDDEFDTAAEQLLWRDGERLHVDGMAPVRLAARELGLELGPAHESTVSGLLIEKLGRVPEKGEMVALSGTTIEILERDEVSVQEIAVARGPAAGRRDGGP
ncbi:MAG: hemolysin family protein [Thermoleophilia bacterium]